MFKRLLKGYLSDLDQFLMECDRTKQAHSLSRRFEEDKHASIALLRDDPLAVEQLVDIWKEY